MKSRKYVIIDSKRFFVFMTLIFIICAIIITLIFSQSNAYSSVYDQRYKEYRILPGDNLWGISLENMPPNYDVRRMVYDIRELNNMETSSIYEGDTIKIPLYND